MISARTNACGRTPPPLSDQAARRSRERAAEEARWEAQLRKIARTQPEERRAAPIAGPAPVTTLMALVSDIGRHDTVLLPRALPIAAGSEPEDLACGKCGKVIAARSSRQSLRRDHPAGDRLVVRCTCRALNLLCGIRGERTGYRRRAAHP